jgi:hypothetical protein
MFIVMTIDWNWFFGAFAQCAAALIAIIGAFIISKLLGESEKEEIQNSRIDDLIIHYNDLKKRISVRYFDWYDKRNIEYSSDLKKSIKNGDFSVMDDDEMLQKLFEIEPDLFGTPSCLGTLNDLILKLRTEEETSFENGLSSVISQMSLNIVPEGLWDKLGKEKDLINQLGIESAKLIEQFVKAKNDIWITKNNLTPIKITIYILCVGLILTVIYPLHFMPIAENQSPTIVFDFELICFHVFSLKGFLLLSLTIVIEGIFGYFLWLLKSVEKKYNGVLAKLEDKYYAINEYSEYF